MAFLTDFIGGSAVPESFTDPVSGRLKSGGGRAIPHEFRGGAELSRDVVTPLDEKRAMDFEARLREIQLLRGQRGLGAFLTKELPGKLGNEDATRRFLRELFFFTSKTKSKQPPGSDLILRLKRLAGSQSIREAARLLNVRSIPTGFGFLLTQASGGDFQKFRDKLLEAVGSPFGVRTSPFASGPSGQEIPRESLAGRARTRQEAILQARKDVGADPDAVIRESRDLVQSLRSLGTTNFPKFRQPPSDTSIKQTFP